MRGVEVSRRVLGALAVAAMAAACGEGGRSDYAKDADSGAAAPATVQDTTGLGRAPDSTAGVTKGVQEAGARGVPAGDTLAARTKGAKKAP